MSLSQQLWSLSALSIELGIDRRTLAKRLSNLDPSWTKEYRNRVEKKWYLKDVLDHLQIMNTPLKKSALLDSQRRNENEVKVFIRKFIGEEVFPKIGDSSSFINIIVNACQEELGLSIKDGLRVYQFVMFALVTHFCESTGDDDLGFKKPEFMLHLNQVGLKKAAANWGK